MSPRHVAKEFGDELDPYAGRTFNVAICGGGPAGASLAIALARQGLSVLLFAQRLHTSQYRLEVLRDDAVPYLDRLGLMPAFESVAFPQLRHFGVDWGSNIPRADDFFPQGWLIDPIRFNQLLRAHAATVGVVVVRAEYLLTPTSDHQAFTLSNGLGCKITYPKAGIEFAVDATGRRSDLGTHLGAKHAFLDGLVGRRLENAHVPSHCVAPAFASVLATERGWWFLAECANQPKCAIFFTDAAIAHARREIPIPTPEAVVRHLPRDACFGNICADSRVLSPAAGHRWLAVGDAAFTCDPLSGAGVFQALNTAAWAAELIPRYWGSWPALAQSYTQLVYERVRELVATRRAVYAAETRWPDSPFWKPRREPPPQPVVHG